MLSGNYIILDAARIGDAMDEAKKIEEKNESFYKTKGDEALQSVAPYLFSFSEAAPLAKFYFDNGWGNSWGVLAFSPVDFKDMYKHFRRFLLVKTEDGLELFFRFYDPRVLRIFLPTCDTHQLFEFFGPVHYFLMEDAAGTAIKFWLEGGKLKTKQIPLEEILPGGNTEAKETEMAAVADEPEVISITQPKPAQPVVKSQPIATKPKWDMFN